MQFILAVQSLNTLGEVRTAHRPVLAYAVLSPVSRPHLGLCWVTMQVHELFDEWLLFARSCGATTLWKPPHWEGCVRADALRLGGPNGRNRLERGGRGRSRPVCRVCPRSMSGSHLRSHLLFRLYLQHDSRCQNLSNISNFFENRGKSRLPISA